MSTNIDLAKVKAAVAKYAPGRINTRPEHIKRDPQDAALRKPLRNRGASCPGFGYKAFMH